MTKNRFDKLAIRNEMALTGAPYSVAARAAENFPLTSWLSIDTAIGGFRRGHLYAIGAQTGGWKSSLAANLAVKFAQAHRKVGYFSLEASADEVRLRLIAAATDLPIHELKNRSAADTPEVQRAEKMLQHSITVNDQARQTASSIRTYVEAHPELETVIVDYFQLLEDEAQQDDAVLARAEKLAHSSHVLKMLAVELDIPVILLVQMNQSVGKPQFRETGAIQQDADFVFVLDSRATPGVLKLELTKNRLGGRGEFELLFSDRGSLRLIDSLELYTLKDEDFVMPHDDEHSYPFFADENGNGLWAPGSLSDEEFARLANEYDELCGAASSTPYKAKDVHRFVGVGAKDSYGDWRIYPCPTNFPGATVVKTLG